VETPRKQFTAEAVTIEEMRDGRVVWSGKAKRADGDLRNTRVWDVELTRHPETPDDPPILFQAPTGNLAFDDGEATFEKVQIKTADGAVIRAESAHYFEKGSRVVAEGPLRLQSKGMTAHAARGMVYLREGRIDLEGPVIGRYDPAAAAVDD